MENQRRSFRLDVEIGFSYELLTDEAVETGIVELRQRPNKDATLPGAVMEIDQALMLALAELRITAPKAAGVIELLNRKVDMLRVTQPWQEPLQDMPLRQVNLSATGLAFEQDMAIAEGQGVLCNITLNSIAWSMQLYARTISSRPIPEGGFKVCLDFLYIRDEDREQLIRFNLLQQQQHLAQNNTY